MNMNPPSSSAYRPMNRRGFIRTSSKTALVLGAASSVLISRKNVLGANDKIGIGFIGAGGRGRDHLKLIHALTTQGKPLRIVAVCDAYEPRLRNAAEGYGAKPYRNHQDLIADKEVDVVCIATPDRLHVPQAMDAIRAGKDVYCEKPMGHWSQFELSKEFYEETRKLGRVVQIGNQANSSSAWLKVKELIQQGAIGRVQHVAAGFYRNGDWGERMPIPDHNAKPGPDLDWQAFLGDAPKVPFSVERFFSWRSFLDYAGGPSTDLFPHVLTPFISALGLKFPSLAVGTGGIFKYDDYGREVPDTFNMVMDYPERVSINLVCTLTNAYNSDPVIRGESGTIVLEGTDFGAGFRSIKLHPLKGEPTEIPGSIPNSTLEHWKNFLECVRTRAKPVSDVEFGLYVQAAMCMATLGFLKNKVARFDPVKLRILL
ncbi:MAG: Gfo/Idh/MocA family oxidoreductase [Verrucomicrobia bacterium]|nr:Gfo/Idh/MocA family oxidoreductase [Verrucomicrobiota bacterium]